MNELLLLAINLTRRCNASCSHCYLDSETLRHGAGELETQEVCHLLDDVAGMGTGCMVVLTGGEPLIRADIEQIVSHGSAVQLPMVVGTNGTLLSYERVRSLDEAGVMGLGISLDSLDPRVHDDFRGLPGGWQRTMSGIENCRRRGLSFQIHFSITRHNVHELDAMISFAESCKARVLNVFFLVCTGRGVSFTDMPAAAYEGVLAHLIEAQELHPGLIIRPRCAPHFKRLAWQRHPDAPVNRLSGQEGDGCIAGTHYCRITPEGGVTACPYMSPEVGNIRETSFPDIWMHAPSFAELRAPKLLGRCGACEFQKLCGGCRARPVAAGGGLFDADPFCTFEPSGAELIAPLSQGDRLEIRWTPEADRRLQRVPGFLRLMVKRRAETYVSGLGVASVTPEHLAILSSRRFGAKGSPSTQARSRSTCVRPQSDSLAPPVPKP